jgi:uncharacterized protein YbaR (Trm112 family)
MQSTPSITEQDLQYLVCPVCHAALRLEIQRVEASAIVCVGCARRYPIVDGLPVLLAERAL